MSDSVYILGGGRTDFKRNLKKEGKAIRHVIIEAGKKAIDDAKIDPGEIQAGAVGNFNAGQFTKQLQLGAFIPEIDPKLRGIPTMHTEAACASGALSVLLGAEWIMGGLHDVVLVVGAEQQKTMSALDGSDVLGAAADYHNEKPEYGDFMFPKLFGRIAQIYIEKYGATEGGPRAGGMEKLRARKIESAGTNARRRSDSRFGVAGVGQKSACGGATEGVRLLADHRWRRIACPGFRKISGQNRAGQKQQRPAAWLRSYD